MLPAGDAYNLRWFTPRVEVDLCGHATLASAHVLWTEVGESPAETVRFTTRSGVLTAEQQGSLIELNFPAEPPEPASPLPRLLEALNVAPQYVGRNRFDYLIEVASEEEVRRLEPDYMTLAKIEVRGVIVTSRATSGGYDFVSRFFAPWAGVNEDPVTGSAHCCLGPYWQAQLDKSEFRARQLSGAAATCTYVWLVIESYWEERRLPS